MSTQADYRAGVRAKGYDGSTDAELDGHINEARRSILRKRRWNYLLAQSVALVTTAGTNTVALTPITDLGAIEGIRLLRLGQTLDLDYLEPQDLRDHQADDDATARAVPYAWTRRGNDLILYPTPDSSTYTLVVDYVKTATSLSGADPDTVIPDADRDLVVWAAVKPIAFRQASAWQMQYADQEYKECLRSALDRDGKQSRSEPSVVKPHWGGRAYG